MTTSITSSPVSEGQKKQYARLLEDAAKHGAELALGKVDIDHEGMQQLLTRGDEIKFAVAATIVQKTRELGSRGITSSDRAREIMGKYFLGIENAVAYLYGAKVSEDEAKSLAVIPFSEATLEECKNTHLLVAGFPMTILDISAAAPRGTFYSNENAWYNAEAFAAKEKVGLRWYLIRKEIAPNSTSITWKDQQKLLGPKDEVPRACELAYAVVLCFLATGERLFPNRYARCVDVVSGGYRVDVGRFAASGLRVDYYYWDDRRYDRIGVASARKFD